MSPSVIVSFARLEVVSKFDYHVAESLLDRIDSVTDLGVTLNSTLNPAEHIDRVVSKAFSLLGFIFRLTRNFKSPQSLLVLYKSLVRPVLDYGSVIWSPYQLGHISQLNKVQTHFLRVLGVRLGYDYLGVPVEELEQRFNLQPLDLRRLFNDLLFVFKLVNGTLDCPDLLHQINFLVPRGTRSMA